MYKFQPFIIKNIIAANLTADHAYIAVLGLLVEFSVGGLLGSFSRI